VAASLLIHGKSILPSFLEVPTQHNDGRPIHTRFHKIWDEKVKTISGGLTILHPTIGYWVNEEVTQRERMIPVRVACTREQLDKILDITLKYYEQRTIFAYKLSEEVIVYDGNNGAPQS